MRKEDGFGALEVGVAGHDGGGVLLGEGEEGIEPLREAVRGGVDGVAHEEAHVGGNLLVAAAACVEF